MYPNFNNAFHGFTYRGQFQTTGPDGKQRVPVFANIYSPSKQNMPNSKSISNDQFNYHDIHNTPSISNVVVSIDIHEPIYNYFHLNYCY